MIEVVGTIFIKDNKILLDKPRKRSTYQMIGGRVEEFETNIKAATRECREELGCKAIFDETKFEYALDFTEQITSDKNLLMHMTIYKYNGLLEGELSLSEEIENFVWYDLGMENIPLSYAIKNHIIPYCIDNDLLKVVDFNEVINNPLTKEEKYIKEITDINTKLKIKVMGGTRD